MIRHIEMAVDAYGGISLEREDFDFIHGGEKIPASLYSEVQNGTYRPYDAEINS